MGTNNNLDEAFFKSMFEDGNLDQPSANFTANVMEKINNVAVKKVEDNQPIIGYKYMALIGLAFVAAAYVIFGMDLSPMENVFGGIKLDNIKLLSVTGNLLQSTKELFNSFQIPPILVIVVIALVSLIGLDKMLKRPFTTNLFVF